MQPTDAWAARANEPAGLCAAFLLTGAADTPRALPSRFRTLAPLAIALMMAGLGAMLLGSGHAH